jgi:hypothetical protein
MIIVITWGAMKNIKWEQSTENQLSASFVSLGYYILRRFQTDINNIFLFFFFLIIIHPIPLIVSYFDHGRFHFTLIFLNPPFLELFHTCRSFFLSASISCSNSSSSNCYSPSSLFLTTEIPSSGKLPTTDCIYLFRFSINLLIL